MTISTEVLNYRINVGNLARRKDLGVLTRLVSPTGVCNICLQRTACKLRNALTVYAQGRQLLISRGQHLDDACVCIYIYIYIYTHICIYIYIHTHTYTTTRSMVRKPDAWTQLIVLLGSACYDNPESVIDDKLLRNNYTQVHDAKLCCMNGH